MTDDLVKKSFYDGYQEGLKCGEAKSMNRIEQLESALQRIADEAFSPQDDDVIWMDDDTPLGQFIDKELQYAALAGEKKGAE